MLMKKSGRRVKYLRYRRRPSRVIGDLWRQSNSTALSRQIRPPSRPNHPTKYQRAQAFSQAGLSLRLKAPSTRQNSNQACLSIDQYSLCIFCILPISILFAALIIKMSGDPRLSTLIEKGDSGDIVIVGSPFDFFRKRTINKGGEDNGPCCLRRFYPKVGPIVNPEFQIDISGIKISDYGNIMVEMSEQEEKEQFKNVRTRRFRGEYVNYYKQSPEKIIERISDTLSQLMINGQLPFVFGGSKECVLASAESFFSKETNSDATFLVLSSKALLKKPFDGDKGTSDNILSILMQKYPNRKISLFGAQTAYFPTQYIQYTGGNKAIKSEELPNISITLLDQIRTHHPENTQNLCERTQAFDKFRQTYPTGAPVFVSIGVDVMSLFMGCRDVNPVGLEIEQVLEIMLWLGKQSNLGGICINQFNPSCEDFESSLKILNLMYYFLMGRTFLKK